MDDENLFRLMEEEEHMAVSSLFLITTSMFAKVLFYVGEFQYGILELLRAQRHVEATVIASALKELSLLATKQSIYETVRD